MSFEDSLQTIANMYDKEKDILEKYQEDTKEALLNLGYAKEKTLNQSMKHFLTLYEKIKDVNPKDPSDYKEISRFSIDDTAVLQIKNMSDIYFDSIGSGVAGAATGAVIALAANGSLGAVTSGLSLAGTFLSMGEVGSAVGMVGSALSVSKTAVEGQGIANVDEAYQLRNKTVRLLGDDILIEGEL